MRAVVLAAGDGGRLGPHTEAVPKPLVPAAGRPIVHYTLDALDAIGVTEACVVTGYLEHLVREALGQRRHGRLRVSFVSNPRYHFGASYSLAAARDFCGDEPFLLVMSDHLLSAPLLGQLVRAGLEGQWTRHGATARPRPFADAWVAADFHPRDAAYAHEATKLAVDATGGVIAIGKHLGEWQAMDTGAFLCGPGTWDAAAAVVEDCELGVIFGELARRGSLRAADVSGQFWYDIDTEADLVEATRLLLTSPETANR